MERETIRISSVQTYIFEYVSGVLWVLTLLLAALGPKSIATILQSTADILKPVAALKLSDLLTGFLIAVAGIVLPYALAMALRPIAIWPMNGVLRLIRLFEKRILGRSRRDLHLISVQRLHSVLTISSDPDFPELLAVITLHDPNTAETIEWLRNEVTFRAASVLPSSLLFAVIAYRASTTFPVLAATITGLVVLVSGAAYSIQMLANWRSRAESLVILYTSPNASSNAASAPR
jgi:hypothetical protein